MFDLFNRYINKFTDDLYGCDYWHDVASLRASEILDEFSNEDWLRLSDCLPQQSENWQARFCESITDDITAMKALPSLLYILSNSDKKEIIILVLESINLLLISGRKILNKELIENKISGLKPNASCVDLAVLNSLELKLLEL